MSEQHESGRRSFLKLIGLGSLVASGAAVASQLKQEPEESEVLIQKKQPESQVTEVSKTPEQLLLERLQAIVNADIFSDARTALEKQYAEFAQTPEEIDKGFWVIQNEQAREMLRDKKWNLRQTGDPEQTGLKKLPDQLQKWAESKAIHPETLAWCYEANDEINATLAAMNIQNSNDNLSVRLNTGGMAMLLTLENRGFINVGRVRATEQMPENQRGTLFELCSKLEPVMGLKLYAPNIAGSQETSPGAQNGGAVGGKYWAWLCGADSRAGIIATAQFSIHPTKR
jgi:hypothetical protein